MVHSRPPRETAKRHEPARRQFVAVWPCVVQPLPCRGVVATAGRADIRTHSNCHSKTDQCSLTNI